MAGNAVAQKKLLIKFITADFSQIIPSRVEEHSMDQRLSRIHCQRLARADLLVEFKKAFRIVRRRVLGKGSHELRLLAEHLNDFLVGADTERADQLRDRDFSCAVHTDIEDIVGIRLVLKPCAAVRDDGAGKQSLADLVVRDTVIDTG